MMTLKIGDLANGVSNIAEVPKEDLPLWAGSYYTNPKLTDYMGD
jgi:hypothetical protein